MKVPMKARCQQDTASVSHCTGLLFPGWRKISRHFFLCKDGYTVWMFACIDGWMSGWIVGWMGYGGWFCSVEGQAVISGAVTIRWWYCTDVLNGVGGVHVQNTFGVLKASEEVETSSSPQHYCDETRTGLARKSLPRIPRCPLFSNSTLQMRSWLWSLCCWTPSVSWFLLTSRRRFSWDQSSRRENFLWAWTDHCGGKGRAVLTWSDR